MQTQPDKKPTMFGAAINGSSSIQPQMHQTNELTKFAETSNAGMEVLSWV